MSVSILPGITAQNITTDRLTTRVLFAGPEDGEPVLFIHGNFSSATWWEETMVKLPPVTAPSRPTSVVLAMPTQQ